MQAQVKLVSDQKLKKDYEITLPNELIEAKIEESANKLKEKVNLKGFRKGQVPTKIIKEKYGQSIMAEESDKLISEEVQKIVKDNNLKLAIQPKIDVKKFEAGQAVEISATFETFPEVPEIKLDKIKITKRTAKTEEKDIEEGIEKLVKFFKKWEKQDDSYKAKKGDAVNIDYLGKIDKEEFEGGAAKGHQLELGSNSFIDNFEDQLIGKKAGEEVKVKVKFPKDYHSDQFAGKKAEFEVKINEVLTAQMPEINDEFVKENFGIENLAKLRENVEKEIIQNYENLGKELYKKELFDFLNKKYDFDLPEGLVEEQLKSLTAEIEQKEFKNDKEKAKAIDEKRKIAQRMIRCGIILNDIAEKNKIEANNEEIQKELSKTMQRFAGQEKAIIEYYQKNPSAVNQLKGNVIEEKTVDFIIEKGNTDNKEISIKDFDKLWEKAK